MVYQYPEKPSCNLIFLSIYEYLHKWSVQKKIYYQDVLHALLSILYMVAAPLVFFFFLGGDLKISDQNNWGDLSKKLNWGGGELNL